MTELSALLNQQQQRYPQAELMDVYKLLYQANFGQGHPVLKPAVEREWLEHEFSIVVPDASQLLLEQVSSDGQWLRLHLAPYIALGGALDPLLHSFVESSRQRTGSSETMAQAWAQFQHWAAETSRQQQFPPAYVRLFGRAQAEQQWPNLPHSATYIRAYKPFYRVMQAAAAQSLCEGQGIHAEPA